MKRGRFDLESERALLTHVRGERFSSSFRTCYEAQPDSVRKLVGGAKALFLDDPAHPSLNMKRVGHLWVVCLGSDHRAVGKEVGGEGPIWFWIVSRAEYDKLSLGAEGAQPSAFVCISVGYGTMAELGRVPVPTWI